MICGHADVPLWIVDYQYNVCGAIKNVATTTHQATRDNNLIAWMLLRTVSPVNVTCQMMNFCKHIL